MLKLMIGLIVSLMVFFTDFAQAGFLDNLLKGSDFATSRTQDDATIAKGLREALSIGTENAVKNVSKIDGYFANAMIKILLPEGIQNVANIMKQLGFQRQVDELILSMNRAAEQAAPAAASFFVEAIKSMTFDDAKQILNGGDTSATDFFKRKTQDKLYEAFKPVVSNTMEKIGTVKSYKDFMKGYESIPFVDKKSLDIDDYVTTKALDGLFYVLGQEEKNIRTNPAARVTDILRSVFGK